LLTGAIALVAWLYFFPEKALAYVVPHVKQLNNVRIEVKDDFANVYTKLVARNRSFLTLSIDSLKYTIVLSDKITFENEKYVGVTLSGYEQDTLDFPITKIPYRDIFRNFRSQLKESDSTNYEFDLKILYSTFFGSVELPIYKSANFKIPRPPELRVMDVNYSKISLKQMIADVKVKVINHGDFSVIVSNMKYSLYVSEYGRAKGKYPGKVKLTPRGAVLLNLPATIDLQNLGKTLLGVIRKNKQYDYSVVIDARVESPEVQEPPCQVRLVKSGKIKLNKKPE